MIFDRTPSTWQELQNFVAQTFLELGCDAKVEYPLTTIRGSINIDVYVEDNDSTPPLLYLCECKYWNSRIPKSVIHSLRSVVSDVGANKGFIISTAGFQSGAFEAAQNSVIELLTWDEFQKLFYNRWFQAMSQQLAEAADTLFKYFNVPNNEILGSDDEELPGSSNLSQEEWSIYMGYFFKKYNLLLNAMSHRAFQGKFSSSFPAKTFRPNLNQGQRILSLRK